MFDTKAFANAAALTAIVLYFVCALLVVVAPELTFNLFALTFHGINTEVLRPTTTNINLVNVIIGGAVTAVWVWITFYLGAYFYNQFRKK